MTGKYVITLGAFPHLFADCVEHKQYEDMGVTSAGFFKIFINPSGELDVAVYGHSESLGIYSDPKDSEYIKVFLKMKTARSSSDLKVS